MISSPSREIRVEVRNRPPSGPRRMGVFVDRLNASRNLEYRQERDDRSEMHAPHLLPDKRRQDHSRFCENLPRFVANPLRARCGTIWEESTNDPLEFSQNRLDTEARPGGEAMDLRR